MLRSGDVVFQQRIITNVAESLKYVESTYFANNKG